MYLKRDANLIIIRICLVTDSSIWIEKGRKGYREISVSSFQRVSTNFIGVNEATRIIIRISKMRHQVVIRVDYNVSIKCPLGLVGNGHPPPLSWTLPVVGCIEEVECYSVLSRLNLGRATTRG